MGSLAKPTRRFAPAYSSKASICPNACIFGLSAGAGPLHTRATHIPACSRVMARMPLSACVHCWPWYVPSLPSWQTCALLALVCAESPLVANVCSFQKAHRLLSLAPHLPPFPLPSLTPAFAIMATWRGGRPLHVPTPGGTAGCIPRTSPA